MRPVHLHYEKPAKELKCERIRPNRIRTEVLYHNSDKLQFELYFHMGYGMFAVERFFLPNKGDDPFFGRNLQSCIDWIEEQYNVKLTGWCEP